MNITVDYKDDLVVEVFPAKDDPEEIEIKMLPGTSVAPRQMQIGNVTLRFYKYNG